MIVTSGRPRPDLSGVDGAGRDIVIFGAGDFAALVAYLMTHDSPHRVVGHTVDREWCRQETVDGRPLVPFEELERHFPPGQVSLLVALGARNINGLRADRFRAAKERGYGFVSYVASRALVWPDLRIGENCLIFEGTMVHPFATIGDDCILRSGSHVSHHAVVGDHCFLAAHAVVAGGARLGERSFLGLNATVRDGVSVAPKCFIAAGAVVTADTDENGVYMGVPAKKRDDMPADGLDAF